VGDNNYDNVDNYNKHNGTANDDNYVDHDNDHNDDHALMLVPTATLLTNNKWRFVTWFTHL
jgi:hypothetical protein